MKEILSRTARDQWATVLDDVQWRGQEYLIMRNGKPVARLVPIEDNPDDRESTDHKEEPGG